MSVVTDFVKQELKPIDATRVERDRVKDLNAE